MDAQSGLTFVIDKATAKDIWITKEDAAQLLQALPPRSLASATVSVRDAAAQDGEAAPVELKVGEDEAVLGVLDTLQDQTQRLRDLAEALRQRIEATGGS